jgi:hypothetical protein
MTITYENTSRPDLYENMDDLIAACHRQIELLIEMRKALLLADLLGIPPKDLKAKLSVKVHHSGVSYDPTPWKRAVLSVRVGDGGWQDFHFADVNRRLWPDDMQQAYDKWQKKQDAIKANKE